MMSSTYNLEYDIGTYRISKQTRRQNKINFRNNKTKNKKNKNKNKNKNRKINDKLKNLKSMKQLNNRYCNIGLKEFMYDADEICSNCYNTVYYYSLLSKFESILQKKNI